MRYHKNLGIQAVDHRLLPPPWEFIDGFGLNALNSPFLPTGLSGLGFFAHYIIERALPAAGDDAHKVFSSSLQDWRAGTLFGDKDHNLANKVLKILL